MAHGIDHNGTARHCHGSCQDQGHFNGRCDKKSFRLRQWKDGVVLGPFFQPIRTLLFFVLVGCPLQFRQTLFFHFLGDVLRFFSFLQGKSNLTSMGMVEPLEHNRTISQVTQGGGTYGFDVQFWHFTDRQRSSGLAQTKDFRQMFSF